MLRKNLLLLLSAMALLALSGAPYLHAQGPEIERSTGAPTTLYHGSKIDDVNMSSGNLRITLPLLHLPGRGLDTDIILAYNSKLWRTDLEQAIHVNEFGYEELYYNLVARLDEDTNGWIDGFNGFPALGWGLGVPRMGRITGGWLTTDGSRIALERDSTGPNYTSWWSFDGTYVRTANTNISSNPVIRYKDGITVALVGWSTLPDSATLKDTNGNLITCTYSKQTPSGGPYRITHIGCTDTIGRVVDFNYTNDLLQTMTYLDSTGSTQTDPGHESGERRHHLHLRQ